MEELLRTDIQYMYMHLWNIKKPNSICLLTMTATDMHHSTIIDRNPKSITVEFWFGTDKAWQTDKRHNKLAGDNNWLIENFVTERLHG